MLNFDEDTKVITKAEIAFAVAKESRSDLGQLQLLIADMNDDEKLQLVYQLVAHANSRYGNPVVQVTPLTKPIENCLKAGLSVNHGGAYESILFHYSTPQNIDVYARLVKEFDGVSDSKHEECFLLKGKMQHANNFDLSKGLSDVFNYMRDTRSAQIAEDAGVPLQSDWRASYSADTVELAKAMESYLSKKTLG